MSEERRLIIPAVLNEVPRACTFVAEAAAATGLDERGSYHCQLAIDEWCTNVIEHGYREISKYGIIEIDCRSEKDRLVIVVSDNSPRFDPTTLASPNVAQPLEAREPGGLGWFLIKKIMDSVSYEYTDQHNRLMMTKLTAGDGDIRRTNRVTFPAHELRGQIWVVTPSGRLDSSSGPMLEATLNAQIESRHFRLIVDMNEVSYLSSGGLKALLSAHKKTQANQGALVLAALSTRVHEVFSISGFDALFTIVDSVQDAAALLTRP
jgi:anti-anti-sigma factor